MKTYQLVIIDGDWEDAGDYPDVPAIRFSGLSQEKALSLLLDATAQGHQVVIYEGQGE